MRHTWLVPLVVFLLMVSSLSAFPEIKSQNNYGPTLVKDSSATVTCGDQVWIPLRTIPGGNSSLRFEIVSAPLRGQLSPPSLGPKGEWRVLYSHGGEQDASGDSFSFRCQAPGRTKSVAAQVVISIIMPPPLIRIQPETIDFGKTFVGQKSRRKVILNNQGGDVAEGRLVIPRGFEMPEGGLFRIPPGEEAVIPVEFSPSQAGVFSGEILTQPFLGSPAIKIKAMALAGFSLREISPLHWEVANDSSKELNLSIENARPWSLPAELKLSPGGKKTLVFKPSVKELETAGYGKAVRISDGAVSFEIPAPSIKPRQHVYLETGDSTNSVQCELRSEVLLNFRIINPNDCPRTVQWSVSSPLGGGTGMDRKVVLSPGEKKPITYQWIPSVPGTSEVTLRVTENQTPSGSLAWKARVFKAESESLQSTVSTPAESQETAEAPVEQPPPMRVSEPSREPVPVAALPGLRSEVKQSLLGKETLILSHDPVPGAKLATIDELYPCARPDRAIFPGLNLSGPGVLPIIGFETTKTPDRDILRLKNPSPGMHSLRVSVWGEDKSQPLATGVVQVIVPTPRPFWKNWKFWLGAVVLGLAIRKFRKRRDS